MKFGESIQTIVYAFALVILLYIGIRELSNYWGIYDWLVLIGCISAMIGAILLIEHSDRRRRERNTLSYWLDKESEVK